jgi:hypothetical protein
VAKIGFVGLLGRRVIGLVRVVACILPWGVSPETGWKQVRNSLRNRCEFVVISHCYNAVEGNRAIAPLFLAPPSQLAGDGLGG